MKIRAEIHEIETKKITEKKSMNLKVGFWKDKQNWKTFSQIHQEKRERAEINKIRTE